MKSFTVQTDRPVQDNRNAERLVPPEKERQIYKIGVVWDVYTSQVESQLYRDIAAFQSEYRADGMSIVVGCTQDDADRLLAMLNVIRTSDLSGIRVWRTYRTGPDRVDVPLERTVIGDQEFIPHVYQWTNYTGERKAKFWPDAQSEIPLTPQGRPYNYNPFERPAPSVTQVRTTNPLVNWVWSSTKKKFERSET